MFQKKSFWVLFSLFILLCTVSLIKYFPRAMSFINIAISMDRNEALQKSKELADINSWGPQNYSQAVYFNTDYETQVYTELEAGGKKEFNKLIKDKVLFPYLWSVRFFKEFSAEETTVWFTPTGEPFGFIIIFPEQEILPSMYPDSARVFAEEQASKKWRFNPVEYELIETKKNQAESGRIDHTFVYEKKDFKLNEAKGRIILTVRGNRFSGFEKKIDIPEDFFRRYEEMRSANETIALTASIAMILLYGFGGITFGLIYLIRTRALVWKNAIIWAFVISFLGFIANFNYFPLSWNWYDTALSKNSFVMQMIINALMEFLQNMIILSLSFMVGESLTRKAFPQHIQFWKAWKQGNANSLSVLGNTLGGYFWSIIDITFVVVFYLITERYFGWWNPSSMSTDPNSIATLFPWFSAISDALHAGFWEETLFRAIPIAGAVLIGRHFKREKLFLILGLIVQALIFGAGHANYAAQPAYARMIELIIPSLFFAYLYIRFGLLTAIITHFSVDAILMSLPIWITSSPTIWIDRTLFIITFLIPVLIIFYQWVRFKKMSKEAEILNINWEPPVKTSKEKEIQYLPDNKVVSGKLAVILGILGFLAWIGLSEFENRFTGLSISSEEAINLAKKQLYAQGINPADDWKAYASIVNKTGKEDIFIFDKFGNKGYFGLISEGYLKSPCWHVRFLKFYGDVSERTEEYNVYLTDAESRLGFSHLLPENAEGSFLTEEQARSISEDFVMSYFGVMEEYITEISVEPDNKPNRADWTFTYADTIFFEENSSILRYRVKIAGEKVIEAEEYVEPEEDWLRERANLENPANSIRSLSGLLLYFFYFIAIITGILGWSKKKPDWKVFVIVASVVLAAGILSFLNKIPFLISSFSTAEPFVNQIFSLTISSVIQILLMALSLSMIITFLHSQDTKEKLTGIPLRVVSLSALLLAFVAILDFLKPTFAPLRPFTDFAESRIPLVQSITSAITSFTAITAFVYFFISAFNSFTMKFSRRKLLGLLILFLVTLTFMGNKYLLLLDSESIIKWIIATLITTGGFIFLYKFYFSNMLSEIFLAFATVYAFQLIKKGIAGGYPSSFLNSVITAIVIILWGYMLSILRVVNNQNDSLSDNKEKSEITVKEDKLEIAEQNENH